jgi:hypothetical protein
MTWSKAIRVGISLAIVFGAGLTAWAADDDGVREIKVALADVDVPGRTVTTPGGLVFSVSSTVVVKVEHVGQIAFAQLVDYVGRPAELKLDASDKVFKIEVKEGTGGGDDDGKRRKGILSAVDVQANRITTSSGQVLTVSAAVVVEVENVGHIEFDQLASYIGRFTKFELDDSNPVIKIEVKSSTDEDDQIDGSDDYDDINGAGGNDDINGGDGDDDIDGGTGNDDLDGEEGDDTIHGGSGNDRIRDTGTGENDDDNLFGDDGNDTLDGGEGNDEIEGGPGNDIIRGGDGDDLINGDDSLAPVLVPAMTAALARSARLRNNDILSGGDGDDTINGGLGNDQIVGGLGTDSINAGDGNDQIWVSTGDVPAGETESIDCGAGRDTVNLRNFPRRAKVTGGQLTDSMTGGTYQFISCERFIQTRNALPKQAQAPILSAEKLSATNRMSLEVFTLNDKRIFQSGPFSENVIESLKPFTEKAPNGIYLYVISVRNADGNLVKHEVRKFVVRR